MSTMIFEVYDALKDAGATEDKARKAAEALAAYENRFRKQGTDHGFLPTHPKQELNSVETGAAPAAPVLCCYTADVKTSGNQHEHNDL